MSKKTSRRMAYDKLGFKAPDHLDPQPDTLPRVKSPPLVHKARELLLHGDCTAPMKQVCRAYVDMTEELIAYRMWAEQALWERVRVTEFLRERYGVKNDVENLEELARKIRGDVDAS